MKNWKFIIEEVFRERITDYRKLNYIYTYVHMVLGEEKDIINRAVLDIEKIVFLSQCYSLKNKGHSMLEFQTYIFDGKVYFKYLSDLLRVTHLEGFYGEAFSRDFRRIRTNAYHKIIKNYSKLSGDELDRQFRCALKWAQNDKVNFIHGKCEFTIARLFARHSAWRDNNAATRPLIKGALTYVSTGLALAWIVYVVAICLVPFGIYMGILNIDIMQLIVFSLLTLPWLCIWTYHIFQPTKFEIEHGYNNDFDYK